MLAIRQLRHYDAILVVMLLQTVIEAVC